MLRASLLVMAAALLTPAPTSEWTAILHQERSSPGDLEVGGEIAGVPSGSTRYVRYQDLLRLPQETYSVSDDSNFRGKTEITGAALSMLADTLGQSADMIVAICYDHYRSNYPAEYVAAHHPLLVLRINGQEREHWPATGAGESMGPYLISHPEFKPAFKMLSHEDERQIPYGVTRIEFRKEAEVFGAIRPPREWKTDSPVGMGYVIARQDCFRCHNMGAEGGTMAARSWPQLAEIAETDPVRFRNIIRNPAAVNPGAKMPGQPGYDDATLDALTAYFKAFAGQGANSGATTKKDQRQ
jgi:mono/diheme cytochrome c family protein